MSPRRLHSRTPGNDPEQVLYLEGEVSGGVARVTGGEVTHARRSLRLRTGDRVASGQRIKLIE